jgi:hypothetical protein
VPRANRQRLCFHECPTPKASCRCARMRAQSTYTGPVASKNRRCPLLILFDNEYTVASFCLFRKHADEPSLRDTEFGSCQYCIIEMMNTDSSTASPLGRVRCGVFYKFMDTIHPLVHPSFVFHWYARVCAVSMKYPRTVIVCPAAFTPIQQSRHFSYRSGQTANVAL